MVSLKFFSLLAIISLVTEVKANEIPFGKEMLQYFAIQPGYTNLNHGSFGATPRSVLMSQHSYENEMEANTDRWFRYTLVDEIERVRQIVADYVNVKKKDLVFIPNASHGVNAVLRSVILEKPCKILYLNTAYPMVKNVLSFMHDRQGEEVIQLNVTFPTSNQDIITLIKNGLETHTDVCLVSVSHITSHPAIILPVKDIANLCHSHEAMLLIDGAHALGHIPLNITDIGADFYVSNGHKWLYSPKGSAVLWVREDRQHLVFPTTLSLDSKLDFQARFNWEGTYDYSAYLSMVDAINFRKSFGEERIFSYMHNLAMEGGRLLGDLWETDILTPDMTSAMVNVRLPGNASDDFMNNLPKMLLDKYDTWVPVIKIQGHWYLRASAQIYNDIADFEMLGNAVLELLSHL
eukprot:TRINITY_DN14921_c0_g1_i1.p1 TRINITY_DN14921_c0_g1~~TRINITY_DN14921_c0_g1_i1.p1  ORF type:complete len:406 (+),score=104.66 TRINITY_DN14921_c0_g1_i1:191-1408(+)